MEKDNATRKGAYVNIIEKVDDLSYDYDTLMYIGMKIRDKIMVKMIDIYATHIFLG